MHSYIQKSQILTQQLALSKQQIFSLKILSMSSYDLFQYVDNIVLSNPGLVFSNREKLIHHFSFEAYAAQNNSNCTELFFDALHEQINQLLCDKEKKDFLHNVIATFLDDNLFLKQEEFLQAYSSIKYSDWLRYLKRLKPVGIGARSMQQRFKQQLESVGLKKSLAYKLVDECWKYFIQKKNRKISALLKLNLHEIHHATQQIQKHCKLKIFTSEIPEKFNMAAIKSPDLLLCPNGRIVINQECIPQIDIDPALKHLSQNPGIDKTYIQTTFKQAQNITYAITKRNETARLVAQTAFDLRQKMPEQGLKKRITLKEISSNLQLSQSTVSRTLNHKTILTADGIKMVVDFLKPLTYHSA